MYNDTQLIPSEEQKPKWSKLSPFSDHILSLEHYQGQAGNLYYVKKRTDILRTVKGGKAQWESPVRDAGQVTSDSAHGIP